MFPLLAVAVPASSAVITFVIVAVLVAAALYYIPRLITLDAGVWKVARIVVILAFILYALALFGVI